MASISTRHDGEVANTAVCKTAIRGCKSRSCLKFFINGLAQTVSLSLQESKPQLTETLPLNKVLV